MLTFRSFFAAACLVLGVPLAAVHAADAPPASAVTTLPAEELVILDQAILFRDAKFARERAGMKEEARNAFLMEKWGKLGAVEQALFLRRAAWLRSHIQEPNTPAQETDRGRSLLIVGTPGVIHSEAARDWTGQPAFQNAGADDLKKLLARGDSSVRNALNPQDTRPLDVLPPQSVEGAHATEIWAYSISAAQRRILSFVDVDGSGRFRLIQDEIVAADAQVSTSAPTELPADLFPPAAVTTKLQPLPALTMEGLKPLAVPQFYKAEESKTLVRFAYALNPKTVEPELGLGPDEFLAKAAFWMQVERDGQPLWQDHIVPGPVPLETQDGSWLTEFSVPLVPGDYTWTAVVDAAGKGGRNSGPLAVPALSGLAVSSVAIVVAVGTGESATLPPAPQVKSEELADFQVGKYLVKPRLKATFKAGETLAVVYQIYGTSPARVSCHFFREGKYIPGIDDVTLDRLPSTEILPQDITDAWPAGGYKVVVTATDVKDPSITATREATFRVGG